MSRHVGYSSRQSLCPLKFPFFQEKQIVNNRSVLFPLALFLTQPLSHIMNFIVPILLSEIILLCGSLFVHCLSAFIGISLQECTPCLSFLLTKSSSPTIVFSLISSVQSLSHVRLFATPWIARQASLSITNSRSSLRFTSIESVMPSSHLILCCPFLLLPPIPPSISLFPWVNSSYQVAKVLEFHL